MIISKYTFFFDIDLVKFYIYNTLSNVLVEIEKDTYRYLVTAKKEQLSIFASEVGSEVYEVLVSKKIVVENDLDGYLLYKSTLVKQRAGKSHMHLTVAPTMDCCFSCHYCFEKYKTEKYMSEDVMDYIMRYLTTLESRPDFKLTWFGGEPLMALTEMSQFYKKLVEQYKKPLFSNIITTGFHINENAIKVMQDVGINQVQITLDGLKETHNKIKNVPDCNDVFSLVMDNVELLLNNSNIHVVFRVNLTKKNAHEYVDLYRYLVDRFSKFTHKGISPAFVLERGVCDGKNRKNYFAPNEIAQFILDLYNKYQIHSPFLSYPSNFFTECAIRNELSISFDPEGYAYKCWEVIGNKQYAIGKIGQNGTFTEINMTILNRHMYGADPLENPICSKCQYLPICNGGCPVQRIENTFDGWNNCCCTLYKGYLEEFMKIHLKLKESGIENKF